MESQGDLSEKNTCRSGCGKVSCRPTKAQCHQTDAILGSLSLTTEPAHFLDATLREPSAETPLHIITYRKKTNTSLNTFQEHDCIIISKLSAMQNLPNDKLFEKRTRVYLPSSPTPRAASKPDQFLGMLRCSDRQGTAAQIVSFLCFQNTKLPETA